MNYESRDALGAPSLDRSRAIGARHPATQRGMTLAEIMVAASLFTVVATGVVSCFIQVLKLSESNLAQSYAHQVAQSIIEQVISVPPGMLFDDTETTIEITLPALNSSNYTSMPGLTLPWASDSTTFTEIGPSAEGVLADAAYVASSNIIRPEKYLRMRVNLQREIEPSEHRMKIVLRYQWAQPDRKGANNAPIFLSSEIRTIRSMALRF